MGKAVVRGASFNPHAQRQPPPPLPMDLVDEFNTGVNENVGADITIQTVSKSHTSEWRERKRQQVAAGIRDQQRRLLLPSVWPSPEHRLVTTDLRQSNLQH